MVPSGRVELPRPYGQRILSPVRLPIPPRWQIRERNVVSQTYKQYSKIILFVNTFLVPMVRFELTLYGI
jgi:hypothetical protein